MTIVMKTQTKSRMLELGSRICIWVIKDVGTKKNPKIPSWTVGD